MNKQSKAGIYLRISRDEEKKQESSSIANQRDMLHSFLKDRKDITLVAEYVDDGHTGFDFDREGFQTMMQDAKDGKIDCIIVKDFSRLGRNFQKTEEYMQRTFPKRNIRFISVANCYDSSREQSAGERLANPIINLLNEFHVMETSEKVRSVLEHYRSTGKFIGNHAPYGYIIRDKALVVDQDAAEIVRRIFSLKIAGYSNQGIGEMLNQEHIKSPLEHRIELGLAANGEHLRDGDQAEWSSVSVRRILENPIYIGTLVQGKTTSVSYRDKRRFKRDASDLIAFENAHEAIISETAFMIVQDLLGRDSYTNSMGVSYLFSGFVFCGGCGNQLYHRKDSERHPTYWLCKNKQCTNRQCIREDALTEAVHKTLQMHMKLVMNGKPLQSPDFFETPFSRKISELKEKIAHYQESQSCLQKQMEQGVITEADFAEMSCYYQGVIQKTRAEMYQTKRKGSKLLKRIDEVRSLYQKYYDMPELTREIVTTFIEKIVVADKKDIQMYFRYQNIFGSDGDTNGS